MEPGVPGVVTGGGGGEPEIVTHPEKTFAPDPAVTLPDALKDEGLKATLPLLLLILPVKGTGRLWLEPETMM